MMTEAEARERADDIEYHFAIGLAKVVLDEPNADPDSDKAILARQFSRADERERRLAAELRAARTALRPLSTLEVTKIKRKYPLLDETQIVDAVREFIELRSARACLPEGETEYISKQH